MKRPHLFQKFINDYLTNLNHYDLEDEIESTFLVRVCSYKLSSIFQAAILEGIEIPSYLKQLHIDLLTKGKEQSILSLKKARKIVGS